MRETNGLLMNQPTKFIIKKMLNCVFMANTN